MALFCQQPNPSQRWTWNTIDDDFYKPKVYHTSENEGFHDETLLLWP